MFCLSLEVQDNIENVLDTLKTRLFKGEKLFYQSWVKKAGANINKLPEFGDISWFPIFTNMFMPMPTGRNFVAKIRSLQGIQQSGTAITPF